MKRLLYAFTAILIFTALSGCSSKPDPKKMALCMVAAESEMQQVIKDYPEDAYFRFETNEPLLKAAQKAGCSRKSFVAGLQEIKYNKDYTMKVQSIVTEETRKKSQLQQQQQMTTVPKPDIKQQLQQQQQLLQQQQHPSPAIVPNIKQKQDKVREEILRQMNENK